MRAFFLLSLITPPRSGKRIEVGCPGNHGDIGGSEVRGDVEEVYNNLQAESRAFLLSNGCLDAAEFRELDPVASQYMSDAGINLTGTYHRNVRPGLIHVALRAMHTQALAVEVPMHPLNAERAGIDVSIPDPAPSGLAATLGGGGTPSPADQRYIRARYSHRSWEGPGPNMLDIDHVREEYPNQA